MSLNKLGRYDIIRVLGKGAMGLVYEARDPNLDRRVAIKTIKVENLSEEAAAEYEARFRTEARSAARLQHHNIVSVYDSDRHGDMAFLVMEFIQGEDLKHHLDGGKRFSLEQSLVMMRELLSALDYAHRQSIVHRDVKPANLLIEADGRVKLTDFGVARIQDSGEVTRTQGSMVGTLKYMSPEQVQGQPIDARADLFAVGIVLYQLLTGKRPFDGDTDFAIIQQIVNHTPAAPSSFNSLLPASIDAVVAKALTKKRDQRFATAQDFALALQQASNEASDPTIVPPASQPGRRAGNNTDTGLQGSRAGSTVRMASSTGTGTGTSTGSTVTQELELVYWKDIKDTDDVEDLQGFLERFPSGIYADLARRRLKKMGVTDGSSTGSTAIRTETDWTRLQTQGATLPPAAAASVAAEEATLMAPGPSAPVPEPTPTPVVAAAAPVPVPPAAAPVPPAPATSQPAVPAPSRPSAAPAVSARPSGNASPKPSSRTPMVLAGVAVLVVAGLAFKFLSGPSAPAGAGLAGPASAASETVSDTAVAPGNKPAAPVAAAPATPASSAVAGKPVAKPVTPKPAAADKPAARPVPSKPAGSETPVAAPVDQAPAPAAAPSNPKQACENRVLLGFQICMNEQCAKPGFRNHAVCVERREQDKLRQEIRDGRH